MKSLIVLLLLFSPSFITGSNPIDSSPYMLFDFESEENGNWQIVNDGVMGGRSKGFVALEDGTLQFTGTTVTRGGGFTSVRTRLTHDFSEFDGLELRVRGSGRTFEVELSDGTRFRGRSVSRRAGFNTSEEWTVVRVPFDSFRSSIFGQQVSAAPMDISNVLGFGLYILDGKDGPFSLEVDEIRLYRQESGS